jgi:hypothetical protein
LAGIEASQRDLDVPFLTTIPGTTSSIPGTAFWRERLYRAYVYWTPTDRISASLDYSYEDFYDQNYRLDNAAPPSTRTQFLPLLLSYFDPQGWFATAKTTYVNQQVNVTGNAYQETGFALVDTALGYRLPKRLGIIQFEVRNLLDKNFRYQSYGLRTQAVEQAPFFPDRAFYGRITLSF